MAGDWIKMRADLGTHPKVVRIMSALKADKLRVIGGLHAVWSIFDTHSEDGRLEGYCPEVMDSLVGWPGFSEAMINIRWLGFEDGETLVMPRFEEHNGKSAKRRAQDSVRKREDRKADIHPQNVQETSASDADKKRTREEKRREEEKHMSGSVSEVLNHLNSKANRNFQSVEANTKLIAARLREGATVEQIKAVIDAKVAEWLNDPKMAPYLRPATLFNAEKFGQYSGALGAARVNGASIGNGYDDLMRGSL
jgi:uncharacterized phage protein (TIGR02220 family)